MRCRFRGPTIALGAVAIVLAACSTNPSFGDGPGGGDGAASATTSDGAPSGSGGDASPTSGPGGDGNGGAPTTSSSSALASTSGSTGTGADCAVDADCYDADPCSDDTCSIVGTCERGLIEPGEAGNLGEGNCPSGVCQVDGSCGLQAYSHVLDDPMSVWQAQAVSEVWGTSPNAPPFVDVAEVDNMAALDLFLVFAADGMLYRRSADAWLAPIMASAFFPGLPPGVICSGSLRFDPESADTTIGLTIPSDPWDLAYGYVISEDGSVTAQGGNPKIVCRTAACPQETPEAGTPPPDDVSCSWAFNQQTGFTSDPYPLGTSWNQTGPNVYGFAVPALVWSEMTPEASPVFDALGDGPNPATVVAAWLDGDTVYLVAP